MGWAEVWGGGGEEGEEGAAESVGGVEQPSPCCPAANTLPGDQRQVLTCTILSGRRIHLKLLRIPFKKTCSVLFGRRRKRKHKSRGFFFFFLTKLVIDFCSDITV